jgi:hypothetical protein
MKNNIYIIIFFTIILTGCEKFLDKEPLDQISSSSYWKTPDDLKLYVNQFYTSFPSNAYYNNEAADCNSDNVVLNVYDEVLAGSRVVPASGGGWSWTGIRSVNYFLTHYKTVEASWEGISQYVGEAHFFRAYLYFLLVQRFGDVPWITKPLNSKSEELFFKKTPRIQVIDSIVADLDKAISYMKPKGQISGFRINKQVALAFKSRVCLFEGTWEKYHSGTDFGSSGSDGKKYLTLARNAAKQIIDDNIYDIYSTGKPHKDYFEFFGQNDYSNNPEVLLWRKYDVNLNLMHRVVSTNFRPVGRGMSKSLVDSYLCVDGLPISVSPLYAGDNTLNNVVFNRDPRLAQSIWIPGDITKITGNDTVRFIKPLIDGNGEYQCTTGYQLKKLCDFFGENLKFEHNERSISGDIIFGFAEVLLNYVEARAELGELTQVDIDITINRIRDRVGVAHLQIDNIANDPKWDFPTLSPIINEIRRERRIELCVQGLRLYDLLRWRAHHLFAGLRPLGAKFIQSDFPNMVIGTNVYIDGNGYIDFYQKALPNGYGFNQNRDYLYPIPTLELTLNKNLVQNPGW